MDFPVINEPARDSGLRDSTQYQESMSNNVDPNDRCKWTEANSDWDRRVKLEPHGNHSDRVITETQWLFPEPGEDRPEEWPPEFSIDEKKPGRYSSAHWDSQENTKRWQQRARSITMEKAREQISVLEFTRNEEGVLQLDPNTLCVPIFEANNGDEYQIYFDSTAILPEVLCPGRLDNTSDNAHMYFQPTPRIATKGSLPIPLPKVAYTLGNLRVRGKFFPWNDKPNDFYTVHFTDYEVVVDMGHRDLPVWIMSSRQQLSIRAFHAEPNEIGLAPYPIFDSLMATKDGGHDIACILPSLRDLASCPPEKRQELYKTACKLVRQTRATVDPVRTVLHQKEVEKLFQNEPDSWSIEPKSGSYFESFRDGVATVWESFTWSP